MERLIFPVTEKEAKKRGITYSSQANKDALFPSRLRELRGGRGVSQAALAAILGVSKSTIGLYETGDTLPDAKTLYDLAGYFEVSADYLLGLSDISSPDMVTKKISELLPLSERAINALQELDLPDDLGGDPNIVFALNALLEGMGLRTEDGQQDLSGCALLDISNYLEFKSLEDIEIPEGLLKKANLPENKYVELTNRAIEAELMEDISVSLKYLRKRYYSDSK